MWHIFCFDFLEDDVAVYLTVFDLKGLQNIPNLHHIERAGKSCLL